MSLFSQYWGSELWINFDSPQDLDHLFIDTAASNTWQIGPPLKSTFQIPFTPPNVIVTDTVNPYPPNNTSSFIIKTLALGGFYYGLEFFSGYYYSQSDSLNDAGKIEFSPDQGESWIDIVNDTAYSLTFNWGNYKPVLTGNSNGWMYFEAMMMDVGSMFQIAYGDTLYFRFSFISDAIPESLDGLMYDNIQMYEMIEGITETRFKPLRTSIFPNPNKGHFAIGFDNRHGDSFQLNIYNSEGRLMLSRENVYGTSTEVSITDLIAGVYYYKLTSCNRNQRGWGKFVINN